MLQLTFGPQGKGKAAVTSKVAAMPLWTRTTLSNRLVSGDRLCNRNTLTKESPIWLILETQ